MRERYRERYLIIIIFLFFFIFFFFKLKWKRKKASQSQRVLRPWQTSGKHQAEVQTKSFVPLFLLLFPGPVWAHSFDQCLKAYNSAKHCICQISVERLRGHNQLHSPTEPASKCSASSEGRSRVKCLSTDLHLYFQKPLTVCVLAKRRAVVWIL